MRNFGLLKNIRLVDNLVERKKKYLTAWINIKANNTKALRISENYNRKLQ